MSDEQDETEAEVVEEDEVETPEGMAPPLSDDPILGDTADVEVIDPGGNIEQVNPNAVPTYSTEAEAEAEEAQSQEGITDGGEEGGV